MSHASQPERSWAWVISLGFVAAGLVQAVAGFGVGIVSMSVLPVKLPLVDASPIVAVFCLVVCSVLAAGRRQALRNPSVRAVLPALLVGQCFGVPLGGLLLVHADPRWLRIVLGACMLLFVGERVMHERGGAESQRPAYVPVAAPLELQAQEEEHGHKEEKEDSVRMPLRVAEEASAGVASPAKARRRGAVEHPLAGLLVGFVSGVLGGALNESGPPVVIYLALKGWAKDDSNATLQVYFALNSLAVVSMMIAHGLLTRRHLYYTAIGLPAAALGVAIGVRLYRRIDQLLFNRLLVGAMLLIGTAYIAHSAVELLGVDRESVAWITSLYKAASDAEDDG